MAITQTMTTSAKLALLKGDLDFDSVSLKLALYTSAADLGAATTAYTATGEASGTGYDATGKVVTKGTPHFKWHHSLRRLNRRRVGEFLYNRKRGVTIRGRRYSCSCVKLRLRQNII